MFILKSTLAMVIWRSISLDDYGFSGLLVFSLWEGNRLLYIVGSRRLSDLESFLNDLFRCLRPLVELEEYKDRF